MTTTPRSYRPEIDGLRAVSVVAVLVFHLAPRALPGGFLGVDLFFVISGYLITQLLADAIAAGDRPRAIAAWFYRRRILRIMPLYALVTVACLAASILVLLPADLERTVRTAVWGAGFQSNRLLAASTSYFAPLPEANPLLHTWSLAIEEQFYLLWPVALLAITRLFGARRALVATAITLLLIVVSQSLAVTEEHAAYFMLRARAYQPMIGACLALLLARAPTAGRGESALAGRGRSALAALGLAAIVASFVLIDAHAALPGVIALVPTLGAVAILAGGGLVWSVLSVRPLVGLGRISYSLYLVHWPVVCFVRYLAIEIDVVTGIAVAAGCIVLSVVTFRWIEQPFRRRAWSLPVAAAVFVAAPAALVIGVMVVMAPGGYGADALPPAVRARLAAQREFAHVARASCHGAPLDRLGACTLGAPGRPTAILWGDSHANHDTGLVAELASAAGVAVRDITANSCPPIVDAHDVTPDCTRRNQQVLAMVLGDAELHTVYLAAAWSHADVEQLPATVARLRGGGKEVVLFTEVPELPVEKVDCPSRAALHPWLGVDCGFADPRARRDARITPVFARLGARIVDVGAVLCDGQRCRQELGEVPLYRAGDRSHLDVAGARAIGHALAGPAR